MKSLSRYMYRRAARSVLVIPLVAGIASVSCAIVGMPLELESAPNLRVERVEDHGAKVFLISGHSGNSGHAVLGARVTTRNGVAQVVVTEVLVTPLRRDGSFAVKVPDNGTVKTIVFGKRERQIWSAGT